MGGNVCDSAQDCASKAGPGMVVQGPSASIDPMALAERHTMCGAIVLACMMGFALLWSVALLKFIVMTEDPNRAHKRKALQ